MHDERIRLQIISNIEIRHDSTLERLTDQKKNHLFSQLTQNH